jgi:hypothetical protein
MAAKGQRGIKEQPHWKVEADRARSTGHAQVKTAYSLALQRRVQLTQIVCKPGLDVRRRNGRSQLRAAHRFHVPISAPSGSAARSEPVRRTEL